MKVAAAGDYTYQLTIYAGSKYLSVFPIGISGTAR
jgi:hypothetical protein